MNTSMESLLSIIVLLLGVSTTGVFAADEDPEFWARFVEADGSYSFPANPSSPTPHQPPQPTADFTGDNAFWSAYVEKLDSLPTNPPAPEPTFPPQTEPTEAPFPPQTEPTEAPFPPQTIPTEAPTTFIEPPSESPSESPTESSTPSGTQTSTEFPTAADPTPNVRRRVAEVEVDEEAEFEMLVTKLN